jgi:hypothetical protein
MAHCRMPSAGDRSFWAGLSYISCGIDWRLFCRQFFIAASLPPASGLVRRRRHGGRPRHDSRPFFRPGGSNGYVVYDGCFRARACAGADSRRLAGSRARLALGFRISVCLRISLLVACWLKLPESLPLATRSPLQLRATLKDYATFGSDPRFLLQSLAIALAASALFIYISAAPVFVLQILHLSETSFAWLFVPMITGIMVGSLAAGRVAHFWRPERTIRIGFFIMTGAAILNVLYAAFFTVGIPWAVLPIMLCTFGMAFVSPAMTILTLDLYPVVRLYTRQQLNTKELV